MLAIFERSVLIIVDFLPSYTWIPLRTHHTHGTHCTHCTHYTCTHAHAPTHTLSNTALISPDHTGWRTSYPKQPSHETTNGRDLYRLKCGRLHRLSPRGRHPHPPSPRHRLKEGTVTTRRYKGHLRVPHHVTLRKHEETIQLLHRRQAPNLIGSRDSLDASQDS